MRILPTRVGCALLLLCGLGSAAAVAAGHDAMPMSDRRPHDPLRPGDADFTGNPERIAVSACVVPTEIRLVAPAAIPERIVAGKGDFPYLTPLPGSPAEGGKVDPAPVYVRAPDTHQLEQIGTGSIIKWYRAPPCVPFATLVALYRAALLAAGWTIADEFHHPADAGLTAHFGGNGRNLWGMLHASANGYALAVTDATVAVSQLVADLHSKCHLALTGVLFDSDKATLKPESDPILAKVATMLAQEPTLRLEVQGHTDDVGGDPYNQRLSEARARAVVQWLTLHGVAADRLTAQGSGRTRPVAPNSTEEGRAMNRRVEIANPACVAKG